MLSCYARLSNPVLPLPLQAAERLMSIHGAEQQQPRAAAPSYLAPTAAFSNKVLRSKIDPGNADPRYMTPQCCPSVGYSQYIKGSG